VIDRLLLVFFIHKFCPKYFFKLKEIKKAKYKSLFRYSGYSFKLYSPAFQPQSSCW